MDRRKPAPQEIYRHFKNNLYQIITVAKHSETGEELVIYQALYGTYGIYARPLEMFMSRVDHEKYPEAGQIYRFEKITLNESTLSDTAGEGESVFKETYAESRDSSKEACAEDGNSSRETCAKDGDSSADRERESIIKETDRKRVNTLKETVMEEKRILSGTAKEERAEEMSEEKPNSDLLEFLDAETMDEKRRILFGMKARITDRLINDMAASLDVTVEEGDLETRYRDLMYCVETKQKFEVERRR